jgi:hypothetical protein
MPFTGFGFSPYPENRDRGFSSEGGKSMKTRILVAVCLGMVFLLPALASAECGTIAMYDRFTLEGMNTITLYSGTMPVARFDVQNCSVQPTSSIELVQNYMCDGEKLKIDGNDCIIMEIKPIGP